MTTNLDEKTLEYLLFASPSAEFFETLDKLSNDDRTSLCAWAAVQSSQIVKTFALELHSPKGVKAGSYALDLAERALLLYKTPSDFTTAADALCTTTAIVPNIPAERFREQNLAAPCLGVAGLSSNLIRQLLPHYVSFSKFKSRKSIMTNIIGAILLLAITACFFYLPFFQTLFAGEWPSGLFKIIGVIICIVLIFSIGLVGAIIFLVVYAFIMSTLDNLIPLTTLIQWVLALATFAPACYLAWDAFKSSKRNKSILRKLAASKKHLPEAQQCLLYFETCLNKAQEFQKWLKKEKPGYVDCKAEDFEKVVKYYQKAVKESQNFVRQFSSK